MAEEERAAKLREAIGDQGLDGEMQLEAVLRMIAAAEALNDAALGRGESQGPVDGKSGSP